VFLAEAAVVAGRTACRVQSIPRKLRGLAAISLTLLLGILLSADAAGSEPVWSYKLYPGPERSHSELAVVQMGDAHKAEFNGRPVSSGDWTEVHLLPGEYTIRWQVRFSVNPFGDTSGFALGGVRGKVRLEAGRTYRIRAERMKGPYVWIEDSASGAVIVGNRVP
jgi:hypothetical protein